ncbi:hypothetical protein TRFO_19198 [Tritrichomonas foetus]|uniref:Uncharacterized protein n=1 Tax=Tritrichomonas foetus TaxID=1144522 RepID=A0A1J4KPP0_9EUKA|nr:hypothetical protein TRFO_19198 [Tritrichomonas foetus]|eukprot:OHT11389.1 hypothetical protein TRFO_19198 [Tritrichomonas foetus]
MANWEVYKEIDDIEVDSSSSIDNNFIQEEEEFNDDYFDDQDDYFYNDSGNLYDDHPYVDYDDFKSYSKVHYNIKMKRRDRCCFRHKTGAGLRKQLTKNGRTIHESVQLFSEGNCPHSYSDRMHELRIANFDDLIPDNSEHLISNRDRVFGCGSKIIIEKRLVKKKARRNSANNSGDENNKFVAEFKVDRDSKHYFDHVSHELMEDGCFVEAKYLQFKEKAIEERASLGSGKSTEMNMLYCFWTFFLREHFDKDMYDEFLTYAREDELLGSKYGKECFFRFCSYGLENFFIQDIYNDFEEEAMADYRKGDFYGLEKFKAFHLNQKHPFEIPIKPETQKELDKFPTCRSFREGPLAPGYKGSLPKPSNSQQRQQQQPERSNRPRRAASDACKVTFTIGSAQPKYIPPMASKQQPQPHKQQQLPKQHSQQQKQQPKQKGQKQQVSKEQQKHEVKVEPVPKLSQPVPEKKEAPISKSQARRKENNKYVYNPVKDAQKEKEEKEKEKERGKIEKEEKDKEPRSLPSGAYRPPSFSESQKKLPPSPNNKKREERLSFGDKNKHPNAGGWTFGKSQPQSLPKGPLRAGQRW